MSSNTRPLNIRLGVQDQEVVARALRELGKDGEAALKKLEKASQDAANRMKGHRTAAEELRKTFDGMAASAGPLGPILQSLGPAGTAAAIGFGALTAGIKAAIGAAMEAENAQVRLSAVLKATGNTAGLTQKQLTDFANETQKAFAVSDEAVLRASQSLIQLGVTGETIKRTIQASLDLAAAGNGTFEENAQRLAQAYARPEVAGRKLLGLNIELTESQRDLLKSFAAAGDKAAAAELILRRVSETVGGSAAAEAGTLGGRMRGLGLAIDDLAETIGTAFIPLLSAAAGGLEILARGANSALQRVGDFLSRLKETPEIFPDLRSRAGIDADIKAMDDWLKKSKEVDESIAAFNLRFVSGPQPRPRPEHIWDVAGGMRAAEAEKAAEKAAAEQKKLEEIQKRRLDLLNNTNEAINDNIAALDRETANLKLGDRERAIAIEVQKQEAVARRANIQLTKDQVEATRRAAAANFDEKASIEAKRKADQEAARAVEKAANEAKREAERRAADAQKIWDNAAQSIQSSFSGALRKSFDSDNEGFIKNFFNRIVDSAKDAGAEILAALTIQPMLGAIGFPGIGGNPAIGAAGATGIGALSMAGNAASLGNFLRGGTSLFGLGGAQGGIARLISTGSLSSVGPVAPGLGSTIGAALPVVGAAAAAIGLARGLGIIGPGKSVGPNAGGQLLLGPGGFSLGPTGADNGGNVAGVSSAISQAAELLNALRNVPGLGTQGSGIASYIDTFGAGGINDAAGLVRDVINKGLITGLKDSERDILNSASDLGSAIEQVLTARVLQVNFPAQIADQLLQATDPKAYALKQLEAARAADELRARQTEDSAKVLLDIEQLYAIRRQEILKRFGETAVSVIENAAETAVSVIENAAETAEQIAKRNAFAESARLGVLEFTDPQAAALARAEAELQQIRNQAVALGAGVDVFADIEKRGVFVREQILEGFNQRAIAAAQQAADAQTQIVENARSALIDAYNRESGALNETITKFGAFSRSLKDFRQSLISGPLSNSSPETRLAETKRLFQEAASLARLGNADATERLPDLGRDYAEALRNYFGSTEAYTQGLDEIIAGVDAAASTSARQVNIASEQLNALNAQTAGLMSVNNAVFSVRDAIANLHNALADQQTLLAALAAAKGTPASSPPASGGSSSGSSSSGGSSSGGSSSGSSSSGGSSSGGSSSGGSSSGGSSSGGSSSSGGAAANPYASEINTLYSMILRRAPDAAGIAYWSAQRAAGQTYAQVAANIIRNDEFARVNPGLSGLYQGIFQRAPDAAGSAYWSAQIAAGVPLSEVRENFLRSDEFHRIYGYAKGGVAKGWAMVGEQGPEIVNFTNPGRVYTADETRAALRGGGGEELAELKAQTRELQALVRMQQAANQALIAELTGLRAASEQQARLSARAAA